MYTITILSPAGTWAKTTRKIWPAALLKARIYAFEAISSLALRDRPIAHKVLNEIGAWSKPMPDTTLRCTFCDGYGVDIYRDPKPPRKPGTRRKQPVPEPGKHYMASVGLKELHAFKSKWPGHGFPDSLARVVFEFEPNGDLVDIEAMTRRNMLLDSRNFDGPALVALCLDAQAKVHPRHAAERAPK